MSKFISMRKVYRDLSEISKKVQAGESFVVFNRSKPAFKIVPISYGEKNNKKTYTLKDLRKIE